MKKKRLGNIVMVLLIAVIAVTGVLTALHLQGGEDSNLGSLYKITAIPDNSLIAPGQEGNVCTVTIVCDTVLDNLGSLDEEKAPYVPKDAVILPRTQVSFTEGIPSLTCCKGLYGGGYPAGIQLDAHLRQQLHRGYQPPV